MACTLQAYFRFTSGFIRESDALQAEGCAQCLKHFRGLLDRRTELEFVLSYAAGVYIVLGVARVELSWEKFESDRLCGLGIKDDSFSQASIDFEGIINETVLKLRSLGINAVFSILNPQVLNLLNNLYEIWYDVY